jgi:hypothetical protein
MPVMRWIESAVWRSPGVISEELGRMAVKEKTLSVVHVSVGILHSISIS